MLATMLHSRRIAIPLDNGWREGAAADAMCRRGDGVFAGAGGAGSECGASASCTTAALAACPAGDGGAADPGQSGGGAGALGHLRGYARGQAGICAERRTDVRAGLECKAVHDRDAAGSGAGERNVDDDGGDLGNAGRARHAARAMCGCWAQAIRPCPGGAIRTQGRTERPNPPLQALEQMADQIVASGVKRIDGDVVGDDRWFVWERYGGDWAWDDLLWEYGAPVSALTVNDNVQYLNVTPAATGVAVRRGGAGAGAPTHRGWWRGILTCRTTGWRTA